LFKKTFLNSQLFIFHQIAQLNSSINGKLAEKKDSTMAKAASAAPYLAPIRAPPSIKARRILKGHFGKITALHWAGDSRNVVSASQDGNLLLWNAVTANKLQSISLKSSYVMAVGIEQSKGNLVACGGLDNLCTIYKMDSPANNHSPVEMASHDGFLSCCRFLSEDQILTSSGDSTCLRWSISSGRVMDTFAEHKADAMYLALRPNDPNCFLSCSVDKTIKLWDLRSPQTSKQTFTGHEGDVNGVDFVPSDNNAFATCSEDGTVRLWDVRAYQEVSRFGSLKHNEDPLADTSGYTSIACSKSGRLIFCGHSDSSVLVYDVLSERTVPSFTINQAHDGHVSCVGIAPDGNALCTGSWDFVLKIWA
jgi:guanine nucleotide-binding protein G(I)/G(S)/G(T) subunit beta-1